MNDVTGWPAIPFGPWKGTCAALHLYTQIVGKYRLAHTPWVNHSWHATLYVNAAAERLAGWDRELTCATGRKGVPRTVE